MKPERNSLIDYAHQELDGVIGAANVPLVIETVYEWFAANNRPKNARLLLATTEQMRTFIDRGNIPDLDSTDENLKTLRDR